MGWSAAVVVLAAGFALVPQLVSSPLSAAAIESASAETFSGHPDVHRALVVWGSQELSTAVVDPTLATVDAVVVVSEDGETDGVLEGGGPLQHLSVDSPVGRRWARALQRAGRDHSEAQALLVERTTTGWVPRRTVSAATALAAVPHRPRAHVQALRATDGGVRTP